MRAIVQYVVMMACSFFFVSCERWSPRGEYKVIGTATINGKEYVHMTHRGWNSEFNSVVLTFYPHYNVFDIGTLLQDKNLGNVVDHEYRIIFFVTTQRPEILKNIPYKIEYNKSLEANNYIPIEVERTLVLDKSKIISSNANNGIAIVVNIKTNEARSMEGYFVIHELDMQNKFCKGGYMLKTPSTSDKEELTIYGKFEAELFKSDFRFLNIKR